MIYACLHKNGQKLLAPAIVNAMTRMSVGAHSRRLLEHKRTLNLLALPHSPRCLSRNHDFQNVVCVLRLDGWTRAYPYAFHKVLQSFSPLPMRIGFIVFLPGADVILPELIAFRSPINRKLLWIVPVVPYNSNAGD